MQQKPIDLTDWHRILAGSTPWSFLLEVVLRAFITYVILMVAVRMLGKRVGAHLSLFELSMVVALAAAVGIPLEVPSRGLLPPVVILTAVIAFQRIVSLWGIKVRRVEQLTTGRVSVLIENGRLLLHELRLATLSRERVYAALRMQGIQHLGQVRRLYLEASGDFSVLQAREPRPGLSIIPESDPDLRGKVSVRGYYVCAGCGSLQQSERLPATGCGCGDCECGEWIEAARELDD